METRKLFYEDSQLSAFQAKVLSCVQGEKGWEILLDATAFYPEGGGQAGDTGLLGSVQVLDTRERQGQLIHFCSGPLEVGTVVEGQIDYGPRFLRMQEHAGEHILSGIVHSRYGYHNSGFHMGAQCMTVDFDGVIPQEDIPLLEAQVNKAVWKNLPIRAWIPSPEELESLCYRTKRPLPWPVRIVEIPGYDLCACCGTHVAATGQIGLVKIFSAMGFRGGTRLEMACGSRALAILNQAYQQNKLVSQAFSAKIMETGAAAQRMNELLGQQKFRISQLEKEIFDTIAAGYAGKGPVVHFGENLDSTGLRELAERIGASCGGTAAVFSGSDEGGYGFCLADPQADLRPFTKAMTQALQGRGGGKPHFQQGRLQGTKAEILAFFQANPI